MMYVIILNFYLFKTNIAIIVISRIMINAPSAIDNDMCIRLVFDMLGKWL